MKQVVWVWIAFWIGAGSVCAQESVMLEDSGDRVEVATGTQKVLAERKDGPFLLSVWVMADGEWKSLFDASRPIVSGRSFDLRPTSCRVIENSETRKAVMFSGLHDQPQYGWDVCIEASERNPWIKFTVTCHLTAPLTLQGVEPVVALWSCRPSVALQVDQGPDSIYRSAGTPHGFGFPAAYFWDGGIEAFAFFDMTPMTWMSREGVCRFQDVRIQTKTQGGDTGLGMHLKKVTGTAVPAGDMVVPFYLCCQPRPERPTKFDALATMIETFAPLHPATSVWPPSVPPNGELTWKYFAGKAIENLMRENETMATITSHWNDAPVEIAEPQETMIVHPDRPVKTAEEARSSWDFSTVNNHLTPWILYARCTGNQDMYRVALAKAKALPRFYDSKAGIIRHGTRVPEHIGDMEMSWQNLFFHIESLRASEALPESDFDPAIAGRVLMAVPGLRELAHNSDYVFPQWFDPYQKAPIVQNDMPALGKVREPWQGGSYAYIAGKSWDYSYLEGHSDEAAMALDRLMNGMMYRESNDVYEATYADPVDFAITELFGNAYGSVGALQKLEGAADKRRVRYARDMLNTLLRLTFWYEDETDSVSRDLKNLGLFYPHCGAANACPWETVEANLCLAYHVKHDPENPVQELLLKLLNLNRINSFYFFPATYSERLRKRDNRVGEQIDDFFPVEPFYTLEAPGGHLGCSAAYMASLAMWNYWMYEALAEVSPRDVMVVNLDTLEDYDEAVRGDRRSFVIFNPSSMAVTAEFRCKGLGPGYYTLGLQRKAATSSDNTLPAYVLAGGIPISLAPMESVRLLLVKDQPEKGKNTDRRSRMSRRTIVEAYSLLQTLAPRLEQADLSASRDNLRARIREYKTGEGPEHDVWPDDISRQALAKGRQVRWVGLFTDELMQWLYGESSEYERATEAKPPVAVEKKRKTLDIPVYEKPSDRSVKIGTIEVVFEASEVLSVTFRKDGCQEKTAFQPDQYDDDWGYGPYFHQTILDCQGDWVLLPKNPLPRPGWISLKTPEGNLDIMTVRPGGIYTCRDESIVVIDEKADRLQVRPEQDCDMWCDSNVPPFKPFEIEERSLEDLRDADGHWLLKVKYTRGC